jgi:hypothetical protein
MTINVTVTREEKVTLSDQQVNQIAIEAIQAEYNFPRDSWIDNGKLMIEQDYNGRGRPVDIAVRDVDASEIAAMQVIARLRKKNQ